MPVAFVETMSGTLREEGGREHSVCFHVRAHRHEGPRFHLSGVIHAAPWMDEAVVTGTLTLSPFPASIAYDLRFRGMDGRPLRLHGAKRPTPLSPFRSMSTLPVTLSMEGEDGNHVGPPLATGTMHFDWLDLPTFIVSWLPMATKPHRQLVARRVAVARREMGGTAEGNGRLRMIGASR